MRKLVVSTLVTLDGVMQDPGGFGEIEHGGWAQAYFDPQSQRNSLDQLLDSDVFLLGRTTPPGTTNPPAHQKAQNGKSSEPNAGSAVAPRT